LIQKVPLDEAQPFMLKLLDLMPPEVIYSQPSPRVIACHRRPDQLPEDVFKKQKKVILASRNPKDTMVSCYHHVTKTMFRMSWESFAKAWMTGNSK